jgi:hypothetical protein
MMQPDLDIGLKYISTNQTKEPVRLGNLAQLLRKETAPIRATMLDLGSEFQAMILCVSPVPT